MHVSKSAVSSQAVKKAAALAARRRASYRSARTPIPGAQDTEAFTAQSAGEFVATYIAAKPHHKPSIRRLREAGKVLLSEFKNVDTAVLAVPSNPKRARDLLQRIRDVQIIAEELVILVRCAERSDIRLSFDWLWESVHGVDDLQLQRQAAELKAAKLGIRPN